MKMNRKILVGLLATSSFTTVPLLAAKCGGTQELNEVIKTLNLGEIKIYEDQKIEVPTAEIILSALTKVNDSEKVKVDVTQLEVKEIKANQAIVEAKKDSKTYKGQVIVTYTLANAKRVDLATVKKENITGISNFTSDKEMANILKKELKLPNLSEKDFTISLESQATNDKEGKLVIKSAAFSKLIYGTLELVVPKLAIAENSNKKLVEESIAKFKKEAEKTVANLKNIEKWEAIDESKKEEFNKKVEKIKEIANKLKDKYTKTYEKLEKAIKDKSDVDDNAFNELNTEISLVTVTYNSTVKPKVNEKETDYTKVMEELKKLGKLKNGAKEADILIDFSN
ncbi:variable surface lipoprotein [Mycoplasmopsis agalactiae]|uniref:variable surface lipoprotein n=1 Tax=Mycoplasmopsis agalactiae TaxID=2110 RepID=UPI001455F5E6|nr:variable surface lipoprotein [Mycoplasmopsis agalactiae]MCE6057020.1 variable surface lipoprotein [Mycoplasmopsis agalactiae]MCE6078808.1 variable surface lipoprotein [Mycoplasmopsis agalactiae]MCE6095190.1 variable surface lipoprotein [Mycoplasmopsis agalactiae]MCE6114445.1 variable surface lipoprotein [Mycoplasmopsis agalactiae]NLS34281.1 variable surface lipoprotein [Mycoplasmopsis agalactiae]